MLICFTGIDGSGKSFQARQLVDQLNAHGYPATYVWGGRESRLIRPLLLVAQRLLRMPTMVQVTRAAAQERSGHYRAFVSARQRLFKRRRLWRLWLWVALIEHAVELWIALLPHLLRRRIVVCDRYIYDSVIGAAVQAGVGAEELHRLLRIAPVRLVPQPDRWFFLDVPAAVAFQRKDDIPDPLFLEQRIPLYQAGAALLAMQVIDGTATPDEISRIIWHSTQALLGQPAPAQMSRNG